MKFLLKCCYESEGVRYPEEIPVTATPQLIAQIKKTQKLVAKHDFISCIHIRDEGLEMDETYWQQMDENHRVGLSYLKVFANSWYWCTQGKYDCSYQSEYEAEVAL